jgi:hypothetical protein
LLEVTGKAYRDVSPIWEDDPFPVRLPVKVLIALKPETAVPILDLRDQLTIFRNLANPHAWTGNLRGSPAKWSAPDGRVVVAALEQASANPVERPLDTAKLRRRSPFFRSADETFVSIPENEPEDAVASSLQARALIQPEEASAHSEIQWLLAKLGPGLNHSQKAYIAASATVDRKLAASLS